MSSYRPYAAWLPGLAREAELGNRLLSSFNQEPDGWWRAYFLGPLHLDELRAEFPVLAAASMTRSERSTSIYDEEHYV